jgi:hypothetical protein
MPSFDVSGNALNTAQNRSALLPGTSVYIRINVIVNVALLHTVLLLV